MTPNTGMSVGERTKRGIAWALTFNLGNQAFQFIVGIVLARLLAPSDFGVFAISGIFTGLAATVSNFGLGAALVQRPVIDETHKRSMLAANLLSSAGIVLILTAAAPLVSGYFRNPLAGAVLTLTAWNFLINAVSSVSFSIMNRSLRFRDLAAIEAAAIVTHGVVALILALRGFGVWAIAWAGVAQSVVRAIVLLTRAGWRPGLALDGRALRELAGFGAGLTVKRILNYGAVNIDNLIIGRRLSTADLGYYTRAWGMMTLPMTQLSRVIMSVLFPAFSRIQDDNAKLIAGYSKVVTVTSLLTFPFLVGLMLVAPSFINVVYGEKWLPAVLPFQIMGWAGMMKAISTYVGSIVDAKGMLGAEIRRQAIYMVLLAGGALFGSRFGTPGVAVAVVLASFAMLVMMQSLLGRITGMSWRSYLGALVPALVGSAVMAAAVAAWQAAVGAALGRLSAALLVSSAVIGFAVYAAIILAAPFPRVRALRRELLADLRRARSPGKAPPRSGVGSETCQESLG
jgi:PST family polysaccharide transporter